MKTILTQLIEEDIRITRLVRSLHRLEIDASIYLSCKSSVVFQLLELSRHPHQEQLLDEYFQHIEQLSDTDKTTDTVNAESVLTWLMQFTGAEVE
jgi:hypothetical protein